MRAIIQRVNTASVVVNNQVISEIGKGVLVLVGITDGDTKDDAEYIQRKILGSRLWNKGEKRWVASVKDLDYEVLLVSQFTLFSKYKGNKLDFHRAMSPDSSRPFFDQFVKQVQSAYSESKVKCGAFGEMMDVSLVNDGPVTIIIDSRDREW